jgi:hypothetical protein
VLKEGFAAVAKHPANRHLVMVDVAEQMEEKIFMLDESELSTGFSVDVAGLEE